MAAPLVIVGGFAIAALLLKKKSDADAEQQKERQQVAPSNPLDGATNADAQIQDTVRNATAIATLGIGLAKVVTGLGGAGAVGGGAAATSSAAAGGGTAGIVAGGKGALATTTGSSVTTGSVSTAGNAIVPAATEVVITALSFGEIAVLSWIGIIVVFVVVANIVDSAVNKGREFRQRFWDMSAYADANDVDTGRHNGRPFKTLHYWEYEILTRFFKARGIEWAEESVDDPLLTINNVAGNTKITFPGGRAVIHKPSAVPDSDWFQIQCLVRQYALTIMWSRANWGQNATQAWFGQPVSDDYLLTVDNRRQLNRMAMIGGDDGPFDLQPLLNNISAITAARLIACCEVARISAPNDTSIFIGTPADYAAQWARMTGFILPGQDTGWGLSGSYVTSNSLGISINPWALRTHVEPGIIEG